MSVFEKPAGGSGSVASAVKNLLTNAGFWFNDSGYVSNAGLTSGQRGHDGFKAGASGCNYTFTQNGNLPIQINITGGTLITAVEDFNFADYDGDVTVSWEGSAQARVKNGLTTDLSSESYAASPITITKIADTGLSLEFNTGTVGKIVVNEGATAQAFPGYDINEERRRSQRYVQKHKIDRRIHSSVSGYFDSFYAPIVPMRVDPAVTEIAAGSTVNCIASVYAQFDRMRTQLQQTGAGDCYVSGRAVLLTAELI